MMAESHEIRNRRPGKLIQVIYLATFVVYLKHFTIISADLIAYLYRYIMLLIPIQISYLKDRININQTDEKSGTFY